MLVELGMQLAGRMVSRTPETQGSIPSTTAFISFIITAMKYPNKSNLRKMGLFWCIMMANSRQRELGAVGHMSSIMKRWMNTYCSTCFIHSSRSESQLGGRGESTIHRGRVFMPSQHDQGSPPQECPGAHLPADSRSCHIENTSIPLSTTQQKHSIPKPKGHREDPTQVRWYFGFWSFHLVGNALWVHARQVLGNALQPFGI